MQKETIQIFMMLLGDRSLRQFSVTFKSMVFQHFNSMLSSPIHLHILTDKPAQLSLNTILKSWRINGVTYSFYRSEDYQVNAVFRALNCAVCPWIWTKMHLFFYLIFYLKSPIKLLLPFTALMKLHQLNFADCQCASWGHLSRSWNPSSLVYQYSSEKFFSR